MHTAVRGQTHEVDALARPLGILIGRDNLRVLEDAAVSAGSVDLYKILIDHTPGTDIEVSHF